MYTEFIKMMGSLSEKQKIAVLLRHTKEFSYKEIGETWSISEYAKNESQKGGREILPTKIQ